MVDVDDVYPLTPLQAGMLSHYLRNRDASAYQVHCRVDLFDPDTSFAARLEARWAELLRVCATLRTTIVWEDLESPLQAVQALQEPPHKTLDWREMPPEEQAAQLAALRLQWQQQPLKPDADFLWSSTLIRTGAEHYQLHWRFHHIILDGWSSLLLLKALLADAPISNSTIASAPSFRTLIDWQQALDQAPLARAWRARLEQCEPTPLPPPDPNTPAVTPLRIEVADLDALTEPLKRFATAQRLGLATLIHGAWALTLQSVADRDDVVFGVTTAGRPAALEGASQIIGLCIDTLPLRVRDAAASERLGDWLAALQRQQQDAQDQQGPGLARLQQLAGLRGDQPLLSSVVVAHGFPDSLRPDSSTTRVSDLAYREHSELPLALLWQADSSLKASLLVQPHGVDRRQAQLIAALFAHALRQIATATAYSSLRSLRGLPSTMTEYLADLEQPGSAPAAVSPVSRRVAKRLHQNNDAAALVDAAGRLTYAELGALTAQVATRLRASIRPGRPIALQLPADRRLISSVHAAWQLGCPILPLHETLPAPRLRDLLTQANAQLLISDQSAQATDNAADVVRLRWAAGEALAVPWATATQPGSNSAAGDSASATAYVMFTSGSTGQPKGIPVSHANLAYSTGVRDGIYPHPGRFLLLSAPAFDSAMVGLFWPHACGGCLVTSSAQERRDPLKIAQLVERHAITHLLCIPALYGSLLELADAEQLRSLECIIVAGEACPQTLPALHAQRVPQARLYNEYGPTEATIWCACALLYDPANPAEPPAVTIGQPIPGTRLSVIDRNGDRRPPGLAGQLVIDGPGVTGDALGAADDDRLTARTTDGCYCTGDRVRWTSAGMLEYLGRIDRQLKINGHRIEPGEVEAVIGALPEVREAAVLGLPIGERIELIACWSGDAGLEPQLRARLEAHFPPYARPTRLAHLAELPRNRNGKLDLSALEQLLAVTPRNSEGSCADNPLCRLFAEALGLHAVAADDDFFALGGDSIVALKLVTLARRAGLPLTASQLFERATPAGLLELVASEAAQKDSEALPPVDSEQQTQLDQRDLDQLFDGL
ncbi:MAG: AMP-binding protein [Pseudomonadota bacterium]